MSTQNEFSYDFCLSGDLNEKLVTAVNLLDEVRKTLGKQIFADDHDEKNDGGLEDFVVEMSVRTLQIKQAIRGLDQDPIV